MTPKERVHAALEGREVDRVPVTVPYSMLYHQDHFAELTGRPQWEQWLWRCAEPDEHVALYREMLAQAPFETLQPQWCPSREDRREGLMSNGPLRSFCAKVILRAGYDPVPQIHPGRSASYAGPRELSSHSFRPVPGGKDLSIYPVSL